MPRFLRIERLIGKERLELLKSKKVVVAGLGAVGGYAVEGLARAGVGYLRVVDFDKVNPTNINRQIYALESTIGKLKTDVAVARVLDINPNCDVRGIPAFIDDQSLPDIIDFKPDLVIDAIDSVNPKATLIRYCYTNEFPIISSMGAALRTDPLKIRIGDISEVKGCPLARHVRKRLNKFDIRQGVDCVYSTELVNFEYREPEEDLHVEHGYERGRKRRVLGSLPTITGIFGLMIANYAIQKLSNLE